MKDVNCMTRALWHWDKYGGTIIYDHNHAKVAGGERNYWDHVEQFNPIDIRDYGLDCIKRLHEHALEQPEIDILTRYFDSDDQSIKR